MEISGRVQGSGLFVLGIVAAAAVFFLDRQKHKQMVEERKKQLSTDYPQLISHVHPVPGSGNERSQSMVQDGGRV